MEPFNTAMKLSDNIRVGCLGMGDFRSTWYGTPDGRICGHSRSSDIAFVCNDPEEYD